MPGSTDKPDKEPKSKTVVDTGDSRNGEDENQEGGTKNSETKTKEKEIESLKEKINRATRKTTMLDLADPESKYNSSSAQAPKSENEFAEKIKAELNEMAREKKLALSSEQKREIEKIFDEAKAQCRVKTTDPTWVESAKNSVVGSASAVIGAIGAVSLGPSLKMAQDAAQTGEILAGAAAADPAGALVLAGIGGLAVMGLGLLKINEQHDADMNKASGERLKCERDLTKEILTRKY